MTVKPWGVEGNTHFLPPRGPPRSHPQLSRHTVPEGILEGEATPLWSELLQAGTRVIHHRARKPYCPHVVLVTG